ncbi:MAG: hypothetical protein IPI10_16175 [Bacteroidetes bacterium]|nr:hypothetical protein [Bacteroidota bacterium]
MYDKVQSTGDFSWENTDLKVLTSAAHITNLLQLVISLPDSKMSATNSIVSILNRIIGKQFTMH